MEKFMTGIQFGWVLNVGYKESLSSQQYNEISRQQIELMREQIDSHWCVDHVQFCFGYKMRFHVSRFLKEWEHTYIIPTATKT
jgi:hypothetical protein